MLVFKVAYQAVLLTMPILNKAPVLGNGSHEHSGYADEGKSELLST